MSIQNNKAAAEKMLAGYAEALNSADTALIPSFYTKDGLFMPESSKALTSGDLLKSSKSFLKKQRFQISFSVQDIVVDGDYAFVQATAKTSTSNFAANQEFSQTSRDFFVLRNEQDEWKIFRYIFNNVKEL
ncbi:MAG: hypothetical protein JWQ14_3075 [Adhaeribacter sp.]|nr:hypothetical protein [Adhaeribacter sp.]